MLYSIAVYDWSLYALPSTLAKSDITGDTHSNDPESSDYNTWAPSWIGATFTFNGGSPTALQINDDDGQFEDSYVETDGAQTLAQAITINGTTYPAGSVIENEFSMLDASGNEVFVVRINGENVGFSYPEDQEPTAGSQFTATQGRDGAPFDSGDGASSSAEPYATIACYAQGTLISTPRGDRPVEDLRQGDRVLTKDSATPCQILWTFRDRQPLEAFATDAKPVLIQAGSLGTGLPRQDLIVSPQHRILVGGGGQLQGPFQTEVFAPAKSLTALPGIRHMKSKKGITWCHFACARHEVVLANGCLSESLLLGRMILKRLPSTERRALGALFGRAPSPDTALNGPPARICQKTGAIRRQIARHLKAQHPSRTGAIATWDRDLVLERSTKKRGNHACSQPETCASAPAKQRA